MNDSKLNRAWVAGHVVPLEEARIPLDDPGFLLGDGVFESLRVRRGKLFRWDLHAERMAEGLAVLDMDRRVLDVAERTVRVLARQGGDEDGSLRVQVVRRASGAGSVTALLRPLPHYPEHLYRQGARLAVADWRRDPDDPLCRVKSLSFLSQARTRRMAQAGGFDDGLIFNHNGRVSEASYANVIARYGKTVYAPGPREGALGGVTRRVLLDELFPGEYKLQTHLDREELEAADEVMLTSTYAGVIPVASIDAVSAGYAGPSGELTRQLTQRYSTLLDTAD